MRNKRNIMKHLRLCALFALLLTSCDALQEEDEVKLEIFNPYSAPAEISSNFFQPVTVPANGSETIDVRRGDQVALHYEVEDGPSLFLAVVFSTEEGDEFAYTVGDRAVYDKSVQISCPGSAPEGFRCLEAGGASMPGNYRFPKLYGTWFSDDFGFCLTYRNDGSGTAAYRPQGFNQGGTEEFTWGVLATSYGMPIIQDGAVSVYQSVNDPQIRLLGFEVAGENLIGWNTRKVNSCPF